MPSWTASRLEATGPDFAVNDLFVVSLGSIDKRLLVNRDQDDGVHGPWLPSQGDRGSCTFHQSRLGSVGP
jgi:hypothetical protein